MPKSHDQTPRSRLCQQQLSSNYGDHFEVPGAITAAVICLFLFILGCMAASDDYDHTSEMKIPALVALIIVSVTWIVALIWKGRSWRQRRNEIMQVNEQDFQRSLRLTRALQQLFKQDVASFPVTENTIAGKWKPFRVEYFVSQALRGQLAGNFQVHFGNMLFGSNNTEGQFSGILSGNSVPNLIDSSTIVFLTDGLETLRVLIPSPSFTKELFTRILENWRSTYGQDSHVSEALKDMKIEDKHLITPLTHPQVIDQLAAPCDLPLDQRPIVTVIGDEIQPGVAVCAALEFSSTKEKVFFPSGFFKQLMSEGRLQLSLDSKSGLTAKEAIAHAGNN